MRAINAIIITSGLSSEVALTQLDVTLRGVLAVGKSPILVLGPDGDEWLSASRMIDQCDLVFDPNFKGGFFSSVKAGLHATNGAAFILAVGQPIPPKAEWDALEHLGIATLDAPVPLLRFRGTPESPYPSALHLATLHGVTVLKTLTADSDWNQLLSTHCRTVEPTASSHTALYLAKPDMLKL